MNEFAEAVLVAQLRLQQVAQELHAIGRGDEQSITQSLAELYAGWCDDAAVVLGGMDRRA